MDRFCLTKNQIVDTNLATETMKSDLYDYLLAFFPSVFHNCNTNIWKEKEEFKCI